MNIYLLENEGYVDYDQWFNMVVIAATTEDALEMHPGYPDRLLSELDEDELNGWEKQNIKCKHIGIALVGSKPSIINKSNRGS